MYHKNSKSSGFTIVELVLAMAFLSFILIFAVLALTQILGVYNKGLTVKAINQSGRSIASEIQRSIRDAKSETVNINNVANGRLCTGTYSYVWSNANAGVTPTVPANSSIVNEFSDGTDINFVRIYDTGGGICALGPTTDIPNATYRPRSTELLGDRLQVRSLQVFESMPVLNQGLFIVRFVITSDDEAGMEYIAANKGSFTESDFTCRPERAIVNQFCASNLFVIYAYAKN